MRRHVHNAVFCALVITTLAGCSRQDLGRTRTKRSVDLPQGIPSANPDRVSNVDRDILIRRFQSVPHLQHDDYRIGPGDTLEISIPALERPDKNSIVRLKLTDNGTINLPLAGKLQCAGLTTDQCRIAIKSAYSKKFLKNPDVAVTVSEYNSVSVIVTGAVEDPDRYVLKQNRTTLFELLARANGLADNHGSRVYVIRKSAAQAGTPSEAAPQLISIKLSDLMNTSDLKSNIVILNNDIITVPPKTQQYIYVLGYVNRPGSFNLQDDQVVDTTRAMALAGGLTASARGENSYIVRETDRGQSVEPCNLKDISLGKTAPVYMKPGDTLVVGSSFLARLAEFIKPSVSAGLNIAPTP